MFKRILVPLVLGRCDAAAMRYACAMARGCGATVEIVVGMSAVSPIVAGWDYFPAGVYDTLDETARAAAARMAVDVRRVLAEAGDRAEVGVGGKFWMTPSEQALHAAYAADLVVVGRPPEPTDADRTVFASLLLGAGRPVLLVPDATAVPAPRRIVVAWKARREAARAVHDALPLLRRADHVDAVRVVRSEPGQAWNEPLLAHLVRHGVHAASRVLRRHGQTVVEAILAHVRETGAELIVAGGYGHARATEHVFGGATHALHKRSPVPVLFSN